MATDLERAYKALNAKTNTYKTLWQYYDGDHPLVYTNKRLEEIFAGLDAKFIENWCAVVVDSIADRVILSGFTAGDDGTTQKLDALWDSVELNLEADDAHLCTFVTGEAFLIVWPDEDNQIQAYYNDSRLCHVFYDAENPRKKSFATKWWDDVNGYRRLTLYYPDRLEYYVSNKKAENISSAKAFQLDEKMPTAENPYKEIPVFHFRTERRTIKSELDNAIPLQNGINKLLLDMMVAAEYGAFRQKWVISNAQNLGKLKNAPNEIWDLPSGDGVGQQTQVGEFSATDLSNYLEAIDKLAQAIGIITRTPKHYFFAQGGDPSGEALIAMEAPLNKKAQDRIARLTSTWRKVAAFALQVQGVAVPETTITPVFEKPETVQPRTQAETREIGARTGIPLTTLLRDEGWSEEQLRQMEDDKAQEQAAAQTGLAGALVEAQRRFDQNAVS